MERAVIDEAMVREAIREYHATGDDPDEKLSPEQLSIKNVTTLCLSFRNILKIDNLVGGFQHLTKLKLDNNVIERIENLDHLVNLEWLDISFNNITKIEGLEKLTKLTDLSLFDNQIEQLEGLSTLKRLNVLSLGNNKIASADSLRTLRSFAHLECLNLKGNPLCEQDDYKITVYAYLPKLKYHDYEMVDPADVSAARDKLQDTLGLAVLEEHEKIELHNQEQEKQEQVNAALYKEANLTGIRSFFDNLIKEDTEFSKLKMLSGFDEVLSQYREQFLLVIEDFVQSVLQRHAAKEEECQMMTQALAGTIAANEAKGRELLEEFDSLRKSSFATFDKGFSSGAPDPMVLSLLRERLFALSDDLMDLEMVLAEQANELIKQFEAEYQHLIVASINEIKSTFRALDDSAGVYQQNVKALAQKLLAAFANDELDDSQDVSALLSDKEAVNTAIASCDAHSGKILKQGDEMEGREEAMAEETYQRIRNEEYLRNRARVSEIHDFVHRNAELIDEKLTSPDDEEDDEEDLEGEEPF